MPHPLIPLTCCVARSTPRNHSPRVPPHSFRTLDAGYAALEVEGDLLRFEHRLSQHGCREGRGIWKGTTRVVSWIVKTDTTPGTQDRVRSIRSGLPIALTPTLSTPGSNASTIEYGRSACPQPQSASRNSSPTRRSPFLDLGGHRWRW